MLHKTKGIVLRTIKYGETSVVVTCFTELYGLQSYMVSGIRQVSKKGSSKSSYFQPASLLDLVIYQNQFNNLQRIKEFKWSFLSQHIFSDIFKHAVSLYMIELLTKCLKEPEPNKELFYFIEDALVNLDEATKTVTANFPLFSLHLAGFFGFHISDEFTQDKNFLDLEEGVFTKQQPAHSYFLEGQGAEIISHILKSRQPNDLEDYRLNQEVRRHILSAMETYYALHISNFGSMKTLPVLREISN